jgi:hypothetical protein
MFMVRNSFSKQRSGLTDEGFERNNHCYIYNILILTDWSERERRRERSLMSF